MKDNRFHYQGADRQIGELKHTHAKMTQHGHRVLGRAVPGTVVPESTENHFARTWSWWLHGGNVKKKKSKEVIVAGVYK